MVIKLNDPLVTNGYVIDFQISPDSSRLVYLANQDTEGVSELYSVPLAGGTVTKLNDPLVTNVNLIRGQISPDSSRVVYLADQDTDGVYELYGVYDYFYSPSFLLFMPAILSGSINKK